MTDLRSPSIRVQSAIHALFVIIITIIIIITIVVSFHVKVYLRFFFHCIVLFFNHYNILMKRQTQNDLTHHKQQWTNKTWWFKLIKSNYIIY